MGKYETLGTGIKNDGIGCEERVEWEKEFLIDKYGNWV
jgi:hypothetical protein